MKILTLAFLMCSATILSNCTSIVDATTDKPINYSGDKRTLGTYIDDKRLEVIVGVNIRKADENLRQSNIDITSFNNIVLITGQTRSNELKQIATATTTAIAPVRKVHNELQIKNNLSFVNRNNDLWLASKVKVTLLGSSEIKGLKIKTIIEDSVVYLMGYVTVEEGNNIANIVSNIKGIREVVKVFEYR